jgi:hypothetical protein
MKKSVTVSHFTMTIICTYLYIKCNKKLSFVKKYLSLLWVFTDFSILLVAFWTHSDNEVTNSNSENARSVCGEAWVWGQWKMSQVLCAFGLLDFTMLRPVLVWGAFLNLWTVYFFNFPNFFRAVANRGYWIRGHGSPPLYCITETIPLTEGRMLSAGYKFLSHG